MKNPENKKYILQETRELKNNEFVYRRQECACKDNQFWDHLNRVYNISYENIDDTTLPDDSNGERMYGIRVMKADEL
ncbi:MAG: hypothetical protein H8E55_27640 [Pelagibacterales bacterium]|nr:hypothetical protein [Pelagibacterales bacterium]